VRIVAYITIPAALGLMILREPIIRMLFQHGQFVAESTRLTARPLLYYAAGLPALACVKLIVPAFYSARDTKTPVIVGLISFALNIVLNFIFLHYLFKRFQNGGPALATVLATFFDFFTLFFIFRLRYGALGSVEIFRSIGKISLCAALMGVGCGIANIYASSPAALSASFFNQLLIFIGLIGGATLLYIGLTWIFRCPEIEEVYGIATRRESAEELAGS
jgi:putative peptidoglycan lipid II flippase